MKNKTILFLILFFVVFILFRSLYFVYHLNFSGDQAMFASKALEIYRTGHPVLIGPPISMNLQGRQMFQGPVIYYEFLSFLFLGKFDPVSSSYIYMIFCAFMIFPLYYGAKKLLNSRAAFILVALYTLLPFYIDFTRFLWNPNFQFSLLPLLILLMGLYKEKRKGWIFFVMSILLGIMLQYHYQFALIILGIFAYYLFIIKIKLRQIVLFISGLVVGFSPLILFELRNHFYNIETIILFIKNYAILDKPGGDDRRHYYLSLSFMFAVILVSFLRNYLQKMKSKDFLKYYGLFIFILFAMAIQANYKKPTTAFWSATHDWTYQDEYKAYGIIKRENLSNFNVTNLGYDTLALVPKYLLNVDGVKIDYADYYRNNYLFVIEEKKNKEFMNDPAYEVNFFRPYKVLKTWEINSFYNMYLVERLKN